MPTRVPQQRPLGPMLRSVLSPSYSRSRATRKRFLISGADSVDSSSSPEAALALEMGRNCGIRGHCIYPVFLASLYRC